jgi:glycosyltransferase involved in cell wall biosynthesis
MPQISTPLISIVIPTYEMKGQGVFFLKRCLDSIEKQINIDPQAVEVVISDQSSDQAIAQFCQQHSFLVHYYRTDTGRGIAAHNLNTGIARAKGQYIKILFQDDILVENIYLSTLSKIIYQENPDGILTGALHTTDGQTFTNPITPQKNPYFLFGNNTVSSPSVITLKREVANILPFDEQLKMLFDCEFYYRLFQDRLNIVIAEHIHIANGIWEGQAQHQIDNSQFTQEVRYLNWKYPAAQMQKMLPKYKEAFHNLYPNATLPFSENLQANLFKKWLWSLQRSQKT